MPYALENERFAGTNLYRNEKMPFSAGTSRMNGVAIEAEVVAEEL